MRGSGTDSIVFDISVRIMSLSPRVFFCEQILLTSDCTDFTGGGARNPCHLCDPPLPMAPSSIVKSAVEDHLAAEPSRLDFVILT
jgi:hypothetical protein